MYFNNLSERATANNMYPFLLDLLSSSSDGEVNKVTARNGNGKSQLLWRLQRKGVNRLVAFYVFR